MIRLILSKQAGIRCMKEKHNGYNSSALGMALKGLILNFDNLSKQQLAVAIIIDLYRKDLLLLVVVPTAGDSLQ